MDAFFYSTFVVALAEIGDKTQLLTLLLAARFANRYAIISAIFVATLVNHGLSALFGQSLINWLPTGLFPWIVGLSLIAVGLWILIPDKIDSGEDNAVLKKGAFLATLILFSIAELGDKTQIATVILAAKYQALWWVIMGSTLGMMIANVPVAYLGQWIISKIPMQLVSRLCCGLFVVIGMATIVWR